MATSTKRSTTTRAAPKRRAPVAALPPTAAPISEPAAKPNLLRAGLKALGNVRDDVVQHQSRVFEAILGIEPAQAWSGLVKRDSGAAKLAQEALGLRKFEAVFDQRVASALERMGLPPIETLQAATAQIDALHEEVAALKAELRSLKAPARKR